MNKKLGKCYLLILLLSANFACVAQLLDRIVAIVNDDIITQSELTQKARVIKKQIAIMGQRLPSDSVIILQVLDKMILNQIQLQMAKRGGLKISDKRLNGVIAKMAKKDGLSLGEFQRALKKEGINVADFRREIHHQLLISKLQQVQVRNKINVADYEIKKFISSGQLAQLQNKKYRLGHILVAIEEAASPDEIEKKHHKAKHILSQLKKGASFKALAIAMSDSQNALQGGELGWKTGAQLPRIFSAALVTLKKGQLSLVKSASGFHLIKLLDVKGDIREIVSQSKVRHILIRTNEFNSESDVKDRLNQLRERIITGESFATLAQANSADTGSALKGGDLGWVTKGEVVPKFQAQLDRLQPGQISRPFQSRYGWHLVEILAKRQHDMSGQMDEVRAKKVLQSRKAEEALVLWLRQLKDEAYIENRIVNSDAL